MTNADMRVAEVRQFCELDESGQQLVKAAMTQLQLSARAYHRIPSTPFRAKPEVGAHHRGFGWGREHPVISSGGSLAI